VITHGLNESGGGVSQGLNAAPPSSGAAQTIYPSGIASAEAFGTPLLVEIVQTSGIASGEAFGTPTLRLGVHPSGIASAEAFGAARLDQTIYFTGIVSAEAFGTASLHPTISPTGIASAEAFGTASLLRTVSPTAIASAEVFGTPSLVALLRPTGIASAEAFGTASFLRTISPTGIASTEAFGTPSFSRVVAPTAILSGEAFGTPALLRTVAPVAIASAEAFGTASLSRTIALTGIASAEAFGTPSVAKVIGPTAIASAEAFGTPDLDRTLYFTGIPSAEAFGSVRISIPFYPVAIPSAEAFGTPTVASVVAPTGIVSAEAFGAPVFGQALFFTGIPSAEAFGSPEVQEQFPGPLTGRTGVYGRTEPRNVRMVPAENVWLYPQASFVPRPGPVVPVDTTVFVSGIPSGEAVGIPGRGMHSHFLSSSFSNPAENVLGSYLEASLVSTGPVVPVDTTIFASGIPSEEAVGIPGNGMRSHFLSSSFLNPEENVLGSYLEASLVPRPGAVVPVDTTIFASGIPSGEAVGIPGNGMRSHFLSSSFSNPAENVWLYPQARTVPLPSPPVPIDTTIFFLGIPSGEAVGVPGNDMQAHFLANQFQNPVGGMGARTVR